MVIHVQAAAEIGFEVWIYRGCIVVLLGILWYLAKGVLKELKLIRSTLQALQMVEVRHEENIKNVNEKIDTHEHRINEHAGWIRDVENKQNSCPYCKDS